MNIIQKKLDLFRFGTLFKIVYLCLVLISFNNILHQTPVKTVFVVLSTGMGVVYLLYRLIHLKSYWKTPYLWVLILFCISYVVSAAVNWKYGWLENAKGLMWMAFQMFLLYACCTDEDPSQYRREFRILSFVFIGYTFLSALVSIGQLLVHYCVVDYSDEANPILAGVVWRRLWGVYTDPNYGAVLAAISFLLSLYLLCQYRKKIARVLMIVNMVFEFLYITFSGSRTGQVCFVVGVCLYTFLYFARKRKGTVWKNRLISLGMAVLIGIGSFVLFPVTRTVYNTVDSFTYSLFNQGEEISPEDQLGREDEGDDISNRRFFLWGSGMEIFVTTPVFGTSFRNLTPYAQEHLPDTYLVNNDQTIFQTTHNSFIDVLVSQGIIGAGIMLCFILLILVSIFRAFPKLGNRDYFFASVLFSSAAVVVVSMGLISDGFYVNSGAAFILWMNLGYLMQLIGWRKKEGFVTEQQADTAVMTFHRARNYGTCLQAMALQKALGNLGCRSVLLDYQPDYIEDSFGVFNYELWRQEKGIKSKLVFLLKTIFKLPRNIRREWNFETFRDRYYQISAESFYTEQELKDASLPYTAYVFGSDQIWNPQLTRGFCGTYFGDFVSSQNAVKASYAASIGISDISDVAEEMKKQVNTLDFIGVRERNARDLLAPLTDKEIVVNADPTLLLDAQEWISMTHESPIKKPYILVYALEINEELIRCASDLAKEKKMPIVFFDTKNRYGCEVISKYAADPIEFLSLLRGAAYVITNSFHGTVFSVVFQKQFLCIPHQTRASRLVNLLEDLGLTDRIQYRAEEQKEIDCPIDYQSVQNILKTKRDESLTYLKMILESKRELNG
jgi:O-antigen ligase